MTPRERLLRLVSRVRRRALLQGIMRAALAAAVGLGLGPLLSAPVLPWLPSGFRVPAVWAFLGLSGVACALLWAFEWRRARPRLSPAQAADLTAAAAPAVRDLVLTGADLAAWGDSGAEARGASEELAAAHVETASAAAREIEPRRALPTARLLPWAGAACAVALLLVGWASWNPGRSVDPWRSLLAPKPMRAVAVGNLKLVLEPPAYTGLPSATLEGVSGAVEALRGSRVTLEGQLSEPVQGGRWSGSDGQTASVEVKGREFRVSWLLDRAGTYDLAFERGNRAVPSDFEPQPMTLRPDERPKVELRAPIGDIEAASDHEVEVQFTASDDFRVDRAELVLQGEVEVRVPVRVTPGTSVEGSARFLALSFPKLGAGAHLRVEAWDSDTVSGPKAGASRSVYVSFLDRKRVMDDIQALMERLFEALLTHLADQLETPGAKGGELAGLRTRAGDLLKLFESLAARVGQVAREDSPASAAVLKMAEGLRASLGPFAEGGGERAEVVAEVERDILFLDRLMKNLQMEEALGMGDELSALQRGLFDELQAGRSPKDLLERVAQIEKLLRQMSERLSKGAGEMPDAFVNSDAVKDMPSSELQDELSRLKKALREGKTEEARRIAEKLLDTLGRWMKSLQDAAEGAAGQEADPALKDLAKLESEVQGLMGDQEQLLQETRAAGEAAMKKAADGLKRETASSLSRLDQRLNAVSDLARRTEALVQRGPLHGSWGAPPKPPAPSPTEPTAPGEKPNALEVFEAGSRVASAVNDVRAALRSDVGRARSGVEGIREAFQALRLTVERSLDAGDPKRELARRNESAANRELQGLLEELEAVNQRQRQALGPREAQALKGLGSEQRRLGDRTGQLEEKLEDLSRRTPLLGPGLPRRARSAQGRMQQASEQLGQADPFGALPSEGEALEELSGIAKALGEARRQSRSGGKGQSGFSLMRNPSEGPGQEGREIDRSRVEIPKEAEARELKAFREEVLKAMRRGGYPRNYEEEVERYYERLIR